MKKVIEGEQGGISKLQNWQGGGGFKFYELAPSLLNTDKYGNLVINKHYNADMLAAAMAKHQGFTYSPDTEMYWKQGNSSEHDFIFTTTQLITAEMLETIHDQLGEDESLLICCTKFQPRVHRQQIPEHHHQENSKSPSRHLRVRPRRLFSQHRISPPHRQ